MSDATLHTFEASDGYRMAYRRYDAVGTTRGRLVLLHGIRSHGGWYTRSCSAFAAAGFEVYFLDRRGAGVNPVQRGDSPNFRRLLDDVAEFLIALPQSQPRLPTHLGGISWGGKLAVGLPYRAPGLVDSLMLFCPGLAPKVRPAFRDRLAIVAARLTQPTKLFPIPLNDASYFTASPEWQAFIDADPHGLRQATARFLFSSVSLDWYLKRAAKHVTMPTLLLLAERDRVIDNARTRAMVARFATSRKTIIEYPNAHHTLEFEPPDHPFVSDCVRWLTNL